MSGNSPKTEKRMKKGETSKYGTTLWSNRASADRIRLGGRFIKLSSPVGRGATLVAPAPLRADMEPPGGPDGQAGCGSRRGERYAPLGGSGCETRSRPACCASETHGVHQPAAAGSASLTARAHAVASFACPPAWMSLITFSTATRTGPLFRPRY